MDELEQLLADAQALLREGVPLADVNIALQSAGFPGDFDTLNRRVSESQEETARGSRGSPGEVLRAVTSGLTLGLSPKILGAIQSASGRAPYRETVEAEQAALREFRGRRPGYSGVAEIVPSLLMPGLATARFGAASRSVPGALARAVGTGAVTGAVSGAGYARPDEELAGAERGAGLGALFSLPFGLLSALGRLGGPGKRLAEAANDPDALRRAAAEAVETGRGEVLPVAALGEGVRREAGFVARRAPETYAERAEPLRALQRGGEERLQRDVSRVFDRPEVGTSALKAARSAEFRPLYDALDKVVGRVDDPEITNFLSRPHVQQLLNEAVETRLIANRPGPIPGFRQLNDVREAMFAKARALSRTEGKGKGSRMAAWFDTARELEDLMARKIPAFGVIQSQYKEASRPINILNLARVESASRGRGAAGIDRAGIAQREALITAFGSKKKYEQFMRAVDQETRLTELAGVRSGPIENVVLGPEDVAATLARGTAVSAPWALSRLAATVVPRAIRERTARKMAPLLFAPSSEIERVLLEIARMNAPGSGQALGQTFGPAAVGVASGRF